MILDTIRAEKDRQGLTNEQLANRSGVPIGTVNRLLSGKTTSPSYINVAALARALGVSMDDAEGITRPEEKDSKPRAQFVMHFDPTNYQLRAENERLKDYVQYLLIALVGLVAAFISLVIKVYLQ